MNLTGFKDKLTSFFKDKSGLALVESALIFPIIISLTFSVYDLGTAIVMNQKVISAGQIAADLLARERTISSDEITQAIAAARLALDPYDKENLGVDIVGIQFQSGDFPQECWRETSTNMSPNYVSVYDAEGLGLEGEGVIMVTTRYTYEPYFTEPFLGAFELEEVAFFRGRKNAFVPYEGGSLC